MNFSFKILNATNCISIEGKHSFNLELSKGYIRKLHFSSLFVDADFY